MLSQPDQVDRVFFALAEPTRRAIVEQLSAQPRAVSELANPFGSSLAAIMQHVKVLEETGLIRTEKIGRTRTCSLEPAGMQVLARWVEERRALWERRFDRLGEILAEIEPPRETKKRKKK
jgi:DNA-binding transcriptional ArsR family regulator